MEYLMTYGWSILVIAIVLMALFVYGVFNSNGLATKVQPGSCSVIRNSYGGTMLSGVCTSAFPAYATQFNGATSYVTANTQGSFGSSETQTAWVYMSSLPSSSYQITWQEAGAGGLYVSSTGVLTFGLFIGGTLYPVSTTLTLSPGTWYFVAGSYSGSTLTACINTVCSTASQTGSISNSINLFDIGTKDTSSLFFKGNIVNVQIYNASLSTNSIQALYFEGIGGVPINLRNLAGWWPLNGNTNDYSGVGNNGQGTGLLYITNWYNGYTLP
jgi:hypothetical protein